MQHRLKRRYVTLTPVFGSPVSLPIPQAKRQLDVEEGIYLRGLRAGCRVNAPSIKY